MSDCRKYNDDRAKWIFSNLHHEGDAESNLFICRLRALMNWKLNRVPPVKGKHVILKLNVYYQKKKIECEIHLDPTYNTEDVLGLILTNTMSGQIDLLGQDIHLPNYLRLIIVKDNSLPAAVHDAIKIACLRKFVELVSKEFEEYRVKFPRFSTPPSRWCAMCAHRCFSKG